MIFWQPLVVSSLETSLGIDPELVFFNWAEFMRHPYSTERTRIYYDCVSSNQLSGRSKSRTLLMHGGTKSDFYGPAQELSPRDVTLQEPAVLNAEVTVSV